MIAVVTIATWIGRKMQIPSQQNLLPFALKYAALGLRVIPLHSCNAVGKVPSCSCHLKSVCNSPGKHPRFKDWQTLASCDPDVIRQWWSDWSPNNLGIVTGEESGIVCIDIDPEHDGNETLVKLIEEHGELPTTWEARTGSGGRHILFAHPKNGIKIPNSQDDKKSRKLGPGVDNRGDGGQFVAPPSIHKSGNRYEWVNEPGGPIVLAPLPEWMLLTLVGDPSHGGDPLSSQAKANNFAETRQRLGRYAATALERECQRVECAPKGGRNVQLNCSAFALGTLVGAHYLDDNDVIDCLTISARKVGLGDEEIEKTIKSGLADGKRKPRDIPERPAAPEIDHSLNGQILRMPQAGQQKPSAREPGDDTATEPYDDSQKIWNYEIEFHDTKKGTRAVKVGLAVDVITNRLHRLTDGWPKRVGAMLFARDGNKPIYFEKTPELFAWFGKMVPHEKNENQLQWAEGHDKITRDQFAAYLRQNAEEFECVNAYPHFPQMTGHYYCHENPRDGDSTAFSSLLDRFCPATLLDRELLKAFFLTLFWGGRPGSRPGFLFTGDLDSGDRGRGIGKTTVVRMASKLCGGHLDCPKGGDLEALKTRILSPEGRGKRLILIDNIKSLKLSWADLEGLITSDTISGRQLYVGEGRLPNVFTVCLTINGASLSEDMAQRVMVIKMARPQNTGTWETDTQDFIEANRWAIIGDILKILEQPGATLAKYTRWASWEHGVLSRVVTPDACQAENLERQAQVNDDDDEKCAVRAQFKKEIRERGFSPEHHAVLIPSLVAAEILERATKERRPINKSSAYLKQLGIRELRKSDRAETRAWIWRGENASIHDVAQEWDTLYPS
jgi:hypothetical protein